MYWNDDNRSFEDCKIIEQNGDLVYIEKTNGDRDWEYNFNIENEDEDY